MQRILASDFGTAEGCAEGMAELATLLKRTKSAADALDAVNATIAELSLQSDVDDVVPGLMCKEFASALVELGALLVSLTEPAADHSGLSPQQLAPLAELINLAVAPGDREQACWLVDLLNDQAAGEAWAFAAGRHPGKALHALRLAHHVSATLAAGTHPQHSQRHRRSDPLRLLRLHGLDDEFWEQLAGAVGEQGFVGLLGELEQAAGSGAGATGAGFCSAGVAFPLACLMRVLGVALEEHPAAQCSAALLQCGAFRAQLGRKLQEARRWSDPVACWLMEAAGAALGHVHRWGALALGPLPEDCQLWGAAVACLQSDLEQHLSRDSLEFREGVDPREDALWQLLHLVQVMACASQDRQPQPQPQPQQQRQWDHLQALLRPDVQPLPVQRKLLLQLLRTAAGAPPDPGLITARLWRTIHACSGMLPPNSPPLHQLAAAVPHVQAALHAWLSGLIAERHHLLPGRQCGHQDLCQRDVCTALQLVLALRPAAENLLLPPALVSDLAVLGQDLPLKADDDEDVAGHAAVHGRLLAVAAWVPRDTPQRALHTLQALAPMLVAQLEELHAAMLEAEHAQLLLAFSSAGGSLPYKPRALDRLGQQATGLLHQLLRGTVPALGGPVSRRDDCATPAVKTLLQLGLCNLLADLMAVAGTDPCWTGTLAGAARVQAALLTCSRPHGSGARPLLPPAALRACCRLDALEALVALAEELHYQQHCQQQHQQHCQQLSETELAVVPSLLQTAGTLLQAGRWAVQMLLPHLMLWSLVDSLAASRTGHTMEAQALGDALRAHLGAAGVPVSPEAAPSLMQLVQQVLGQGQQAGSDGGTPSRSDASGGSGYGSQLGQGGTHVAAAAAVVQAVVGAGGHGAWDRAVAAAEQAGEKGSYAVAQGREAVYVAASSSTYEAEDACAERRSMAVGDGRTHEAETASEMMQTAHAGEVAGTAATAEAAVEVAVEVVTTAGAAGAAGATLKSAGAAGAVGTAAGAGAGTAGAYMAVQPAGITAEKTAGAAAVAAVTRQAAAQGDASSAPQTDQDTGSSVPGIHQVLRPNPDMQMLSGTVAGASVGVGVGTDAGTGSDVLFGYTRAVDGKASVIREKGEAACYRYSSLADDDRLSDVALQQ